MKKRILILILLFCVAFAISFFVFQTKTPNKDKPLPPSQQFSWQDIAPGITTEAELSEKLGPPLETKQSVNGKTFTYRGDNQYWPTTISTTNTTVTFIQEHVFLPQKQPLSAALAKLNTEPTKLFGPEANAGILLYAYPEKGVAYLANEESDTIVQSWYFPPTTIAGFLSMSQSQGYSLNEESAGDVHL